MSHGNIIRNVLNIKLLKCFLLPLTTGLKSGTTQSLQIQLRKSVTALGAWEGYWKLHLSLGLPQTDFSNGRAGQTQSTLYGCKPCMLARWRHCVNLMHGTEISPVSQSPAAVLSQSCTQLHVRALWATYKTFSAAFTFIYTHHNLFSHIKQPEKVT